MLQDILPAVLNFLRDKGDLSPQLKDYLSVAATSCRPQKSYH